MLNEIKIQRQLNHPNIVRLYRVYEDLSHISYVLDYVPGKSLLDLVWEKKRVREERCLDII
jgi:serine/threonine protein kinase